MPVGALGALELEGASQHLTVEGAGEAAVTGDDDDRDPLHVAPLQEREIAE